MITFHFLLVLILCFYYLIPNTWTLIGRGKIYDHSPRNERKNEPVKPTKLKKRKICGG